MTLSGTMNGQLEERSLCVAAPFEWGVFLVCYLVPVTHMVQAQTST
jgi:hypothetical protein